MARAKLTGSLLVCKDAPPATTLAQRVSAPSNEPIGRSRANPFESVESALHGSDCTDAPASAEVAAVAGRSGSTSPTKKENRRFGPIIRFGLAICGVAATTAVGIVLFMLTTGHIAATIALQSIPTFPSVSTPVPASRPPSAELQVGVIGASALETSARVGLPIEPATTGASATSTADPEPPPTSAAAPISPQPEPATAGDAPSPAAHPTGTRLPAEDVAALLARGDALFGNGDIVSARLFYERAAEGGDAQAVLRLGETYDPAFLAWARLNGVYGDAAAAAQWYRHALALGATEAQILLTGVAANDEVAKGSRK